MIQVLGQPGRVHILHHGLTCSNVAATSMVFVLENLRDCSCFEELSREAAIKHIQVNATGPWGRSTSCPTLADLSEKATRNEDECKALSVHENAILRQHRNHLLSNQEIVVWSTAQPASNQKMLATSSIAWFSREHRRSGCRRGTQIDKS
jgi:hypothetical protein